MVDNTSLAKLRVLENFLNSNYDKQLVGQDIVKSVLEGLHEHYCNVYLFPFDRLPNDVLRIVLKYIFSLYLEMFVPLCLVSKKMKSVCYSIREEVSKIHFTNRCLNDEHIRASLGISYLVSEFINNNITDMSIFMFHSSYTESENGVFCLKYSWKDGKPHMNVDTNYPNGLIGHIGTCLPFYCDRFIVLADSMFKKIRKCWDSHPYEEIISLVNSQPLQTNFWNKIGNQTITPGLLGEILKDEKVMEDVYNALKKHNHYVGWWSEIHLRKRKKYCQKNKKLFT
jgi:hypothetical protein